MAGSIKLNSRFYALQIITLAVTIIVLYMGFWNLNQPSEPATTTQPSEDLPVLWEPIMPVPISRASTTSFDIYDSPPATPIVTPIVTPAITTVPTPTLTLTVKTSEYDLFCQIIALEGHPKYGYDNYLQIATVILNRVNSDMFPDTITEVLSQKNQFSTYNSSRKPVYNDDVYLAADDALLGKRNLPNYVIAFITVSAYKTNVANGGWFARAAVYETSHNSVWCYLP